MISKFFFCFIIVLFGTQGIHKITQTREETVKRFLTAVKGEDVDIAKVRDKYLMIPDELEKHRCELLGLQIQELHKRLTAINIGDIVCKKYKDIPDEQKVILTERPNDVYVLEHNGKHLLFILFSKERIESFSVMDKGVRKFFL